MVNVAFVPPANVKLAGAVLKSAPAEGTVTVMVVDAPTESLMVSVLVPTDKALMVSADPVMLALTTDALLLLTL